MADIQKVGLLAIRNGRMLLCRKKRGTQLLILPGGKLEKNETDLDCLRREVREELGKVKLSGVQHVGSYTDRAARENGPPKIVHIELYSASIEGEPVASSEIADLIWFSPDDGCEQLSPSLRNKIVPDLVKRGLL